MTDAQIKEIKDGWVGMSILISQIYYFMFDVSRRNTGVKNKQKNSEFQMLFSDGKDDG